MNLKSLLLGGTPKKPVTIADIEAAIVEAETARAAQAELLQTLALRRDMLLIDGDDKALDAIEREQSAAARELDRLDAALPRLRDRLAALQAAAQEAETARRRGEMRALVARRLAAAAAFDRALADAASASEEFASTSSALGAYTDLHGVAPEQVTRTWPARIAARHASLGLTRLLEIPLSAAVPPAPMIEAETATWGHLA